jgi:MFS family permease
VGGVVDAVRPPLAWRWSYVAFRYADGATSALIPLAVVLHYGLPLWVLAVTTACMNLVGVPATFLWASVVDRVRRRRRIVVGGFAVAGSALVLLAFLPTFPLYLAGAMLFTMFGVATSPAASTLALQGVPKERWALATSSLSRRTGLSFLAGMATSIAVGLSLQTTPFAALFAASAVMCLSAAVIALRTLPPAAPATAPAFDAGVAAAGQRLFDRPVFFPGRIRHRPTLEGVRTGLREQRLWPLGVVLTFMGSVAFFTSYPGVLANELGLAAGVVLLCQAPSHIVTPFAYPWAARMGQRVGKSDAVARGALLRLVGIPGLALSIVLLGDTSIPLLVVFHAVMGFSFSLIQVNTPLILADIHPGGKGQGVGLYHAALGAGTLTGSVVAFVLLRLFDYWVSYVFAGAMTLVGVLCLLAARRGSSGLTTTP